MHHDYSTAGAYFVTINTHGEGSILTEVRDGQRVCTEAGRAVLDVWRKLPQRYPTIDLDTLAILSDHVHFILWIHVDLVDEVHGMENDAGDLEDAHLARIRRRRMLLPKVVGYFKMNASKRINRLRGKPVTPVWQRNYYERVIRSYRELARFRRYIVNNQEAWAADQ